MSSLWTPDGEREVPRDQGSRAEQGGPPPEPGRRPSDPELAEELGRIEAELLETPVADVVANHCYGLFQLAALHLSQKPPHLEEARLAIDAFGAMVETLGPRLGAVSETLTEGLAQVRLAFVEISKAGATRNGEEPPAS
jgi:hypothetical protein